MNQLLQIEKVKSILEISLHNGVKAFTSFINKEVRITKTASVVDCTGSFPLKTEYWVLCSELKGDLKGKSLLIFTKQDALTFCTKCGILDEIMSESILLEFDNIITAAVITKIAEITTKNCYAYVPSLQRMNGKELEALVKLESENDVHIIQTKVDFHVTDWECNPEFYWFFDESITDLSVSHE